jgi:hypothetical protein
MGLIWHARVLTSGAIRMTAVSTGSKAETAQEHGANYRRTCRTTGQTHAGQGACQKDGITVQ